MVDKTPILIDEIAQMIRVDSRKVAAYKIAENVLEKAGPYYIEKGRQEVIKEIENSTVLSASVRDDMLEQRHKDWQVIKEGKDV